MERQIIAGLMAILVGLAAWNMKPVDDLQLEVKGMMVSHVSLQELQELKTSVQRLQWLLESDAATK